MSWAARITSSAAYNGSAQRLYINGTQVAEVTLTGAITATNTNNLYIGWWSATTEFFKGTIDEAAVYPTALNAAQISSHYTAGITSLVSLVQNAPSAQLVSLGALTASQQAGVGGTTPGWVAFDSGLHRAYVSRNVGRGRSSDAGVTIFDTRSWKRIGQVTTSPTPGPSSIAVDPVTHLVYVTAAVYTPFDVRGSVEVIDGHSGKLVDSIPTGPGPKAIAVNPTTHRVT